MFFQVFPYPPHYRKKTQNSKDQRHKKSTTTQQKNARNISKNLNLTHNTTTMEHVFYKCHEKIGRFFLSKTTHRTRSIIEHAVMIMAVCSVSTVLVCHYSFVYRGQSQQPIISSSTSNNVVKNEYNNINRGNGGGGNIPMCLRNIKGWKDNMEITHVLIRNIERSYVWDSSDHKKGDEINNCLAENLCHVNSNNITEPLRSRSDLWFSYSQAKGLLLLPESVQKEHAFSYQYLVISPFDPKVSNAKHPDLYYFYV